MAATAEAAAELPAAVAELVEAAELPAEAEDSAAAEAEESCQFLRNGLSLNPKRGRDHKSAHKTLTDLLVYMGEYQLLASSYPRSNQSTHPKAFS